MPKLILYVDGGSRGNPGPAGYGVLVRDAASAPEAPPAARLQAAVGVQTNNYAEYCGLIAALEYARDQGAQDVEVYSDSELMVRQMQGRYAVKSANLQPLHARARVLAQGFGKFAMVHVRREHNREADRLANLAMDQAATDKAGSRAASAGRSAKPSGGPRQSMGPGGKP